MLLIAWMMGSSALAQHTHVYVNGFCTVEGCTDDERFERPEQAADGFFEIRNAGNVEWLSLVTSQGLLDNNARLMNDIDF